MTQALMHISPLCYYIICLSIKFVSMEIRCHTKLSAVFTQHRSSERKTNSPLIRKTNVESLSVNLYLTSEVLSLTRWEESAILDCVPQLCSCFHLDKCRTFMFTRASAAVLPSSVLPADCKQCYFEVFGFVGWTPLRPASLALNLGQRDESVFG